MPISPKKCEADTRNTSGPKTPPQPKPPQKQNDITNLKAVAYLPAAAL
jgi:hypothetical protein